MVPKLGVETKVAVKTSPSGSISLSKTLFVPFDNNDEVEPKPRIIESVNATGGPFVFVTDIDTVVGSP